MPHFSERSYRKELLDAVGISFEDIRQNMKELDVINRVLGGHRVTLKGVEGLILKSRKGQMIHVVELGSGGGDNLRVIRKWAEKIGITVKLSGIDINPECVQFAKDEVGNKGIEFICNDYKKVHFKNKPHIIFSSLFCHHFTNDELVSMLSWMKKESTIGFFINDLHRNAAAYYSIKALTKIFSKSYLVKNDAPLSVLRGFKRNEWTKLLNKAGIKEYSVQWQWAFRWLIIHAA